MKKLLILLVACMLVSGCCARTIRKVNEMNEFNKKHNVVDEIKRQADVVENVVKDKVKAVEEFVEEEFN